MIEIFKFTICTCHVTKLICAEESSPKKMISALDVKWFLSEGIIKKPKYTAFFEP